MPMPFLVSSGTLLPIQAHISYTLAYTLSLSSIFNNEAELHILDWIQTLRTPALDTVMRVVTSLGSGGFLWIALAILLLIFPKTRTAGIYLTAALLCDLVLCNILVKNIVARTRPFDVNTAIQLIIAKPHDFSFPSGHTAASFASVVALYFGRQRNLWKLALIISIGIAFSRMYLYVHYPTDVLGGVIFGTLSGYIGVRLVQHHLARKEKVK